METIRFLYFLVIDVALVLSTSVDDAVSSDTTSVDDIHLQESIYEGLLDGLSINFDYISMSRYDDEHPGHETEDQPIPEKEHESNLHEAQLEAEYMTSHRPLESTKVDTEEAEIFAIFNILIHYLALKAQRWSLVEPETVGLDDHLEKHMVFTSQSDDQHIPKIMVFTVGNMKKTMPVNKSGKSPIVMTCLEAFVVSRLAYVGMSKLVKSTAPVETKLQYLNRWINITQKHFILFLPYISMTAQKCSKVLKENPDPFSADPYKHLLENTERMVHKRSEGDNSDLQVVTMLDSELHSALIKVAIQDRHFMPSMLKNKDHHIKEVYKHHSGELTEEVFSAAANMVLANIESELLNKVPILLEPKTWGCDLSREEAAKSEHELITMFMNTQKKLNMKIILTVRKISINVANNAKNDDKLKESIIKYAKSEHESAVNEAKQDAYMKKCIEDAESKLMEDSDKHKASGKDSDIVNDLLNYKHEGWMECMSGRIFEKFVDVCKLDATYCKGVMNRLREELDKLSPDSTVAIVVENLQFTITAALLKNGDITVEDIRKHIIDVSQHELSEMGASKNSVVDNTLKSEETSVEIKRHE